MKKEQMITATNLTQDVKNYWNQCLAVNSSWRAFTHILTVLNTFDCLYIEDVDFVVELLEVTELFENEDYSELLLAAFEFASERVIPVDDLDCSDLAALEDSGFSQFDVVERAQDLGISEDIIADYTEG